MKFNIIINASVNWQRSCQHALDLCKTIINDGHEIGLVFFYGQSIKVINSSDDVVEWQTWQQTNQIQLCLCSTMLENEIIINSARKVACFQVVGLASWINALDDADKTIEIN